MQIPNISHFHFVHFVIRNELLNTDFFFSFLKKPQTDFSIGKREQQSSLNIKSCLTSDATHAHAMCAACVPYQFEYVDGNQADQHTADEPNWQFGWHIPEDNIDNSIDVRLLRISIERENDEHESDWLNDTWPRDSYLSLLHTYCGKVAQSMEESVEHTHTAESNCKFCICQSTTKYGWIWCALFQKLQNKIKSRELSGSSGSRSRRIAIVFACVK